MITSPPGFEPGTFELEVQCANPLRHGDLCRVNNRRMICVDSLYGPFSHLLKLSTLNAFYLTLRQKCKKYIYHFPDQILQTNLSEREGFFLLSFQNMPII